MSTHYRPLPALTSTTPAHDGLLNEDAAPEEGQKTLDLVGRMVDDLSALNDSGSMGCPPEILEKTWAKDMVWYGPAGIGATYTIPRYQEQHQLPFRAELIEQTHRWFLGLPGG